MFVKMLRVTLMLFYKAACDNVVCVCTPLLHWWPKSLIEVDLKEKAGGVAGVSLAMPTKLLDSARRAGGRVLFCWFGCCMSQAGCMKSVKAMFNILQHCRLFAM